MPGVPTEMKAMFTGATILPPFQHAGRRALAILSRTLHTFGLGESRFAESGRVYGK
jgi:molybdopterin-biosynthesis enzyme MoeA-like protein